MKRLTLMSLAIIMCLSLSACGVNNSKQSKQDSEASSLKTANSKLKKQIKKQNKKPKKRAKQLTRSASSTDSSSQRVSQQPQTSNTNHQQAKSSFNGVHNADEAVAAARAKYGDDNGSVHWGYMTDASTGQPIRNADGSYFVKGTDNQSMSGTRYSVNVYPDGSMTSN